MSSVICDNIRGIREKMEGNDRINLEEASQ